MKPQNRKNSALVRLFVNRAAQSGQAIRLGPSADAPAEIIWNRTPNEAAEFTGGHAVVLLHEADDLIRNYPEAALSKEEALLFVVQGKPKRGRYDYA